MHKELEYLLSEIIEKARTLFPNCRNVSVNIGVDSFAEIKKYAEDKRVFYIPPSHRCKTERDNHSVSIDISENAPGKQPYGLNIHSISVNTPFEYGDNERPSFGNDISYQDVKQNRNHLDLFDNAQRN
jgi:hypothetical protein